MLLRHILASACCLCFDSKIETTIGYYLNVPGSRIVELLSAYFIQDFFGFWRI